MLDEALLKQDEQAVFTLRTLFRRYGYLPYKMSKFEEYDLYVRNKDFLVSDRIITFNDTNGRLLALKPDVTLSIIQSLDESKGGKRKVCYNENVYRVSGATKQFKEILQTGLECMGDIDLYDLYEVVYLAAHSLSLISNEFMLDLSHIGILNGIFEEFGADEAFRQAATGYLARKNVHDLHRLCAESAAPEGLRDALTALVRLSGDAQQVLPQLMPLCHTESAKSALAELTQLCDALAQTPFAARIRLDFSIVNNMKYYNGVVFRGYLSGVCEGVLAGGQYDKLMQKMGKSGRAIGFAVYLDLLDSLQRPVQDYDVDTLVLYDETTGLRQLAEQVRNIASFGRSVRAEREAPAALRWRRIVDLRKEARSC